MSFDFTESWQQRWPSLKIAVKDNDQHIFRSHISSQCRSFYAGFDPTSDSLHIGSLLPIMALQAIQRAGHRPIILVGGGTGMLGDPSGKNKERVLLPLEEIQENSRKIKIQLSRFFDFNCGKNSAVIVDNYDWLSRLDVLTFMREVGKRFPVNYMRRKESIQSRLEDEAVGISFTEFSYLLFQSYDFWHLNKEFEVTCQIGGSDQWGNITSGIRYIRQVEEQEVFGLTLPLVVDSKGKKFGKSEAGTVWLDSAKTSPFALFQHLFNTSDEEVFQYLRHLTFVPVDQIRTMEQAATHNPQDAKNRRGQRLLAEEITRQVHGEDGLKKAIKASDAIFQGNLQTLSLVELEEAFTGIQAVHLHQNQAAYLPLILEQTGLAASKSAGRRLIKGGGIQVNGVKITNADAEFTPDQALHGKFLIIKKGKHVIAVIIWKKK